MNFTINPDAGYSIISLIVDDLQVADGSSYTFNNVQAGHSISAVFAMTRTSTPIPTPTSTTPSTPTVSPTPPTSIPTSTPISISLSTSTPTPTSTPNSTETALSGYTNSDFLRLSLFLLMIPFGALAFGIVVVKTRKKSKIPRIQMTNCLRATDQKNPKKVSINYLTKLKQALMTYLTRYWRMRNIKLKMRTFPIMRRKS